MCWSLNLESRLFLALCGFHCLIGKTTFGYMPFRTFSGRFNSFSLCYAICSSAFGATIRETNIVLTLARLSRFNRCSSINLVSLQLFSRVDSCIRSVNGLPDGWNNRPVPGRLRKPNRASCLHHLQIHLSRECVEASSGSPRHTMACLLLVCLDAFGV